MFYELNWDDFLDTLPRWHALTFRQRFRYLSNSKSETVKHSDDFHEADRALVEAGFCIDSVGGMIKFNPDLALFRTMIHAMNGTPIFAGDDDPYHALEGYLNNNFTAEMRRGLCQESIAIDSEIAGQVTSTAWVKTFLGCDSQETAHAWCQQRSGSECVDQLAALNWECMLASQVMIKAFMNGVGTVEVNALRSHFSKLPAALLTDGLKFSLRYLLFYCVLDEDLFPVAGVWPSFAKEVVVSEAFIQPVEVKQKLDTFSYATCDMAVLLMFIQNKPARIKGNDFAIFAKHQKEIAQQLTPLPKAIDVKYGIDLEARASSAAHLLDDLGFASLVGEAGKDLRLEITPLGASWLTHSSREQFDVVVSYFMARHDDPFDTFYDEDNSKSVYGLICDTAIYHYCGLSRTTIFTALQTMFGECLEGESYALGNFVRYHSQKTNPLTTALSRKARFVSYSVPNERETSERWNVLLTEILLYRMVPFGFAVLSLDHQGEFCFTITSSGRYVLKLATQFVFEDNSAPNVIVQPNFELVFLSPSMQAQAKVYGFCERIGHSTGAMFKISKESVMHGAKNGMSCETMLENLAEISSRELPGNVVREITGWINACRFVDIENVQLIRCPDKDTALKISHIGGSQVELISETDIAYHPQDRCTLLSRLAELGIFLNT